MSVCDLAPGECFLGRQRKGGEETQRPERTGGRVCGARVVGYFLDGGEGEVASRALQLIPYPVPGIPGALEQHEGTLPGHGVEIGP